MSHPTKNDSNRYASYHDVVDEVARYFQKSAAEQKAIDHQLEDWYQDFRLRSETYIGYPNNTDLNHSNLGRFLDLAINNVGDPFVGNNGISTFEAEREVVHFFADALGAPAESRWGYVTNGGTESNLNGLWVGKTKYPHAIVYYSEATHYSILKNLELLGLKGARIQTSTRGSIDVAHLSSVARGFCDYPAIFFANCGTTMTGAIDDIDSAIRALQQAGIKGVYVHVDAALSGGYLPFVADSPMPKLSGEIGSIGISGHKFTGSPIPCGIFLQNTSVAETEGNRVDYIRSVDRTVSGSRDGISVLALWQQVRRLGAEGFSKHASHCLELAETAVKMLNSAGVDAWREPWSITVVFPTPTERLVRRWHLATQGQVAHLITMPGVPLRAIELFVHELKADFQATERTA